MRLARPPEGTARFRAGVLAIFQNLYTVDEDLFHPDGVLVRLGEGGTVGDTRGIEYDDIREHSFPDKSTVIESQVGCRERTQSAHRFA